jgi:hypothetical protein
MIRRPRGITNCNPGNIRHGANWVGMAPEQTDPAFVQFSKPEYGIRAIARVLMTYEAKGIDSVREIIERWAPSSENDTEAYVQDVASHLDVDPDDSIDIRQVMPELIAAIIQHENGQQPYSSDQINQGISLA